MHRDKTRETLAKNVAYLMLQRGWTQSVLAKKADISQRSVSNLLHPETHSPKLETVEAVAEAFGLNLWHMIMPSLIEDLAAGTSFSRIYDDYMRSSEEGKKHIERVAQREAEYRVSNER